MKDIKGIYVKGLNYLETSRGVAYVAHLFMDGKCIGYVENLGNGGATSIYVTDPIYRDEFNKRMNEYLKEKKIKGGMVREIFAEHLIDLYEFGEVQDD